MWRLENCVLHEGSLLGSSMLGMPLPGDPNLSVTCGLPSHILALKGCQPPKSPKPRHGLRDYTVIQMSRCECFLSQNRWELGIILEGAGSWLKQ